MGCCPSRSVRCALTGGLSASRLTLVIASRYAPSQQRLSKLGAGLTGQGRTGGRMRWLEVTKAIALVLIVFNHALERMDIYPLVANPSNDWAPFADRVSQLSPTTGSAWDLVFNAIRYPGLLGEVGVQLFVVASGLGLTLSAMRKGVGPGFLKRRIGRVAPIWIVVHLLALLASLPVLLFIGGGAVDLVAAPWDARFWASIVGFRITPETIYYLVPSWWFIALLIQLYLVFPFLYRLLVRIGSRNFWFVIAGSVLVKVAGLMFFDTYLDAWSRGAIFITRLPEFAFGMLVAHWLSRPDNVLRRQGILAAALLAIPVGIGSSLTLIGNAWGPFLYGAGVFVVLYRWLADRKLEGRVASASFWTGRHSLSLFIVHQPVVFVLLPGGVAGPARVVGGLLVAAAVSVVAAVVLEFIVARAEYIWRSYSERGVLAKRVLAVVVVAGVLYGAVVAADVWVRNNDPQEVLGWGERPSLIADDVLGWRLAPEQTTRLQWQSYDYTVTANQLGFPGPADSPSPDDLRILTIGDAFTSAEGVDTEDSWPRLLADQLGDGVTVWNGAVTGYGPLQYAGVAAELGPLLTPDVVVVGFFVNEFSDAESDPVGMQDGIGFGRPDPTGIVPSLQWGHLSKYLRYHVTEPVLAKAGIPNRTGYLLSHLYAFESGATDDGYQPTLAAMTELRRAVPEARVVMMLIPASVQVCEPGALEYYPDNVDLADFDLDQPQRMAIEIAEEVGMEVLDLRPVLEASTECPYQPENMHWLRAGHELAADAVGEFLDLP